MSIEIDILNGDASWPTARPLFDAVWPPEVVEKAAWAGIVFAHPDLRVLVEADPGGVVCHVGVYRREVTLERPQDAGRRHRRRPDPRGMSGATAMPASRSTRRSRP